jgi:hypothetical protein
MEFGVSIVRSREGRGFQDFDPENARDGVKLQGETFHYGGDRLQEVVGDKARAPGHSRGLLLVQQVAVIG